MIKPLEIWQSENITNLLVKFFRKNFQKALIDESLAEELVLTAWEEKLKIPEIELQEKVNKVLLKARSQMTKKSDEVFPLYLCDFSHVETFLDVGANRLTTINNLVTNRPNIKRLIGIDIIPKNGEFIDASKSEYYQVDEDATRFPIENDSIDFISIQFVLHHFPNEDSIERMLKNCHQALRDNGTLLLWEETFEDEIELEKLVSENNAKEIMTDRELTEEFYSLSFDERWQFIIANDWIINVNNLHMPWTGQYRKWTEWVGLLEQNGFKLSHKHNLGLRVSGQLKQGVHILGEFRK